MNPLMMVGYSLLCLRILCGGGCCAEGVVGLDSKRPPKGKISGVNQLLAATRLNMHGNGPSAEDCENQSSGTSTYQRTQISVHAPPTSC